MAAQRALYARIWPEAVGELRVRMGLHVGYVERGRTGYVGLEVHRAARVAAAAHGGQLLLTAGARELVGDVVATQSLGIHRLKDFPAPVQLYCAVGDGRGAEAFPPPRTYEVRPTNLPAGAPALVGRESDLERVRSGLLVDGERLVTLTGRGGSGKTSLARAAGAQLLDQYPGGVWWADLASVRLPAEVPGVVAAALGSERDVDGSPLRAIEARPRTSGATLLILDNMEQLITSSGWLAELIGSLPELRVLITSQLPLRIPQERVIQLDALDDDSAAMLIEQVARRRGGTVPSDAGTRAVLLEVVRLLDGLPLALELAAARSPRRAQPSCAIVSGSRPMFCEIRPVYAWNGSAHYGPRCNGRWDCWMTRRERCSAVWVRSRTPRSLRNWRRWPTGTASMSSRTDRTARCRARTAGGIWRRPGPVRPARGAASDLRSPPGRVA